MKYWPKFECNWGQLSIGFGESPFIPSENNESGFKQGLKLQCYWPFLRIKWYTIAKDSAILSGYKKREIIVSANNIFRILLTNNYWCIGIRVFGFGVGIGYQKDHKNA